VLTFNTPSPDCVRAVTYDLMDSTTRKIIFRNGYDMDGEGIGQVGLGLLPVVKTAKTVLVDTLASGFTAESQTNLHLTATYQYQQPINRRRPGYPYDLRVTFYDAFKDTSLLAIGLPARPAKFLIHAVDEQGGEMKLKFRFRDLDRDGTPNQAGEFIDVATFVEEKPATPQITWRLEVDTTGQAARGPILPARGGDIYWMRLDYPLEAGDAFVFSTAGQRTDAASARAQAKQDPYVVPNPYVGSASFEPERFAVSGRGERRIEFRALPKSCTIRIFSVRGELVQTLEHDGSDDGFIAWDLRTKDNLDAAPGLYIFHVDSELGSKIGKFAIIK